METGDSNFLPSQVHMACVVRGPNQCSVNGTTAVMLDPPGTNVRVPASDSPQQAAVLADVCTKAVEAAGGSCSFDPTDRDDKAFSPQAIVSEPVVNCDPESPLTVDETISHKVGTTSSIEQSAEFEVDLGLGKSKVKFAVGEKYKHQWLDEYDFEKKISYEVQPLWVGWVEHAAPVIRFTGDFTMTIGNSTFTLTDAYFDHPDDRRKGAYFKQQEKATSNDLRRCEGHRTGTVPLGGKAQKTAASDTAGLDTMRGGPGSDALRGLAGNDSISGEGGGDSLSGGPGADLLVGGAGRDVLDGGPGGDMIVDTHGPTRVRTGSGAGRGWDYVYVRDGRADDRVLCGSRETYVVADRGDRVGGPCGEVIRQGPIGRATLPVR